MAFHRRDNELNMDQVAAFLKEAVSKVESNPEYYEELKKVFKKNVPLTRRSYVAAFLLKCSSGSIFRFNNTKSREEYRRNRDESHRTRTESHENGEKFFEQKEKFQRVTIDAENGATVFVGIGRNRRVFPNDIVGLFAGAAGISPARIGKIRVLANYSFVELFKDDAEKAINILNGYEYRGRKLSVSFSAPIVDSFTASNSDTVAQQAAFAKEMEKKPVSELSDEEIMALRAPRSSSTADIQ